MSKDQGLSLRGGALVLKTISIFLSSGRNAKSVHASQSSASAKAAKPRRMDKDNKNKISSKLLESCKRDTHFSRSEIEALYKIYKKLISLDKPRANNDKRRSNAGSVIRKPTSIQEGINRTVFCELLHNTFSIVSEDMLMDRIFCVWDKENLGLLTPHAWFSGLSIYLRGSKVEQIDFCFAIYDLNADGFISKDEMFQLLKNCLVKHPQDEDPDEGVKDLVEIVMRKLDRDRDGRVSLDDFRGSVEEEPLLLEAFGTCLPSERFKDTFLATLKQ